MIAKCNQTLCLNISANDPQMNLFPFVCVFAPSAYLSSSQSITCAAGLNAGKSQSINLHWPAKRVQPSSELSTTFYRPIERAFGALHEY